MKFSVGRVGTCSRRMAFACAVLALCSGGACAHLLFGQAPAQVSAHELAARVDRHYDQLHSLKAGFREDYAGLGMNRTESGTLFLRKPGRMLWQYSTPAGKIFLLDGKYAWLYTKGDAQIQRVPAKELDDLRSPLRFLLGHTQLEKELSGLKLEGAANGLYRLSGLPKGQENRVTRLELTVTAAGAISSLEVQEVDGATTRFTFTGEQPDATIPAEMFHFTPPAGVPVVDAMPPV
ncbi:MAG: outer membrane lipoprotein carrier protein LolA [Terracidiphilus sp.]|nr:outer membrane lipoprotein carrier protein LolA [Terracidiphilus sp.]MDR3798504.1 outer membrane lipoprotein carrier protein LolA [Terracidiphilus sp.]